MYKACPLLIAVILSTSISVTSLSVTSLSVTSRWSQSKMSFMASSLDFDNQQKTVLRPELFVRCLVKGSSILSRSDLHYRSQTNEELRMVCPEAKLNSSHPLILGHAEYPHIAGSPTFRRLFDVMEQHVSSVLDITDKHAARLRATERAMVKVMLLVLIQTLLGGNSGIEMRCLVTAVILYFDVSNVLALPVASISPSVPASWVTSSIVNNSQGLRDRLNVTATQPLHPSAVLSVTQLKEYGPSVNFYKSTITHSPVHFVRSTAINSANFNSTQRPVTWSNTRKGLLPIRAVTHSKSEIESLFKQGSCENGWLEFSENRHCYKLVKEAKSFNHAQKVCFYKGTHLVTITTKNENDYIYNVTRAFTSDPDKRAIWIGLERLSSDSALHWVDGKPLVYQKWAPGEPDSNGACVKMIHRAWWEDTACVQPIYFVCERDGPSSPPYSRAVELGVLVGIPMACTLIMLSVVVVLFVKSVRDSEGTHFGYGTKREIGTKHSCMVNHITSNGHIGPQDPNSELDLRPMTCSTSRHESPRVGSRRGSCTVEAPPEIMITPGTPELPERQEARVFTSTLSIEQEPTRVQSTTSLDHLVSTKSYFKSKGRRMRSLRKSEAVISPAGKEGTFRKRDQWC